VGGGLVVGSFVHVVSFGEACVELKERDLEWANVSLFGDVLALLVLVLAVLA
jgi:hypothetical protein